MSNEIADKMRELNTADEPVVETPEGETPDTEVPETETETPDAEPDLEAGSADDEPEALEPDKKPKLFMSPANEKAEKKAAADKAKAAADKVQKAKMPDSVRSKISAEERRKLEADYAWAQGITKEEGAALRELRDLGNTQPVALIDRLIRNVHNNPVTRAALGGYFASIGLVPKGSPEAAQVVDDDPMPQPDTEQGYTTAGLAKLNDWQQRQILKKVDERVAPLMQDRNQAAESKKTQAFVDGRANRAVTAVTSRPGFKENHDAIVAAYNALPRPWQGQANEQDHPQFRDESELLLDAYHTVTAQKNTEVAQKKWIAAQKAKGAVNTVNPGSAGAAGATTVKKPTTFKEVMIRMSKGDKK